MQMWGKIRRVVYVFISSVMIVSLNCSTTDTNTGANSGTSSPELIKTQLKEKYHTDLLPLKAVGNQLLNLDNQPVRLKIGPLFWGCP